jgi:hypothetical protein
MPHFYLHICNGSGFTEDEQGSDFADVDAARDAAITGIRDLMAGELLNGEINLASFIEIEDEGRNLVRTVSFTEAVDVRSDPCPPESAARKRFQRASQ